MFGNFLTDPYLKLFLDRDLVNFSGHRTDSDRLFSETPTTNTYTKTSARLLFFQRPTRGNLRAKAINAKALKPFYSAILNEVDCNMFLPLDTCLWHVARDLKNSVIAAERLIRFGPDR